MVATFKQPDYTNDQGTEYPTGIDAGVAVLAEQAAQFAVNEQSTPDMTIAVRAGRLVVGSAFVERAAQTSPAVAAPTTNPRNDLGVIDKATGDFSWVTGVEAASPSDPALPAGKNPICRLRATVGMAAIANSMLDDLRSFGGGGGGTAASQAEMEAASSDDVFATPGNLKHHPGVAAADVNFDMTGTFSIRESHNVTSVTDLGIGRARINFTDNMATVSYRPVGWCLRSATTLPCHVDGYQSTVAAGMLVGSCEIGVARVNDAANQDVEACCVVFFGDLA